MLPLYLGPCASWQNRFFNCQLGPTRMFSFAKIHKSWLEGLDVEKLQKDFPDRVQIQDPHINFRGPAFFTKGTNGPIVHFMKYSDSLFRRSFQIAVGAICFAIVFVILDLVAHDKKRLNFPNQSLALELFPRLHQYGIAALSGLSAAFIAGKVFDRIVR